MMLRSPLSGPGCPAARPILADPRYIKLYARDGVPPNGIAALLRQPSTLAERGPVATL
jgi:hypothetical protein